MIQLQNIKRTDPRILENMKIHYSQPKGFVGRNICYAILWNEIYYGSIVGGSATLHLPNRNEYFKIDKSNLNNIINNIFFHVEKQNNQYPCRNFTTLIIKKWREQITKDWETKYNDKVIGFETLVELPRSGECYKKDGWILIGQTIGYTCKRISGKGTDNWSGKRVWNTKNLRPKLVFVKKYKYINMKLAQSYSRQASIPINHKPQLFAKYFPLPTELTKYITIQSKSGMPAKDYSYFQEVVDLLLPILQKNKIQIIHIGRDEKISPINGTIDFINKTSLGQTAYILKKSLCHLSVDSWSCHFAGAEEIPLVSLYGSTSVENHSPYHFNPDKTIFLESHRNGNKPSFAREESPKTVDFINPEDIANSVCKLLNLDFNYPFTSIYIGNQYQSKILESAVDSVVDVKVMGATQIILRLDLNFNLNILSHQLALNPCQLVTNKPIPIDILNRYKNNILGIVYRIDKNHSPEFIKNLIENKIGYQLISNLPKDELGLIKLDYMDYGIIFEIKNELPEKLKTKTWNNLYLKTSKLLLANNKFYNSVWAYKNGKDFNPQNNIPIQLNDINLKDLYEEIEFCNFLDKIN